jgi:hypothetical protein
VTPAIAAPLLTASMPAPLLTLPVIVVPAEPLDDGLVGDFDDPPHATAMTAAAHTNAVINEVGRMRFKSVPSGCGSAGA